MNLDKSNRGAGGENKTGAGLNNVKLDIARKHIALQDKKLAAICPTIC